MHTQMVLLLGLAVYGLAGGAFLAFTHASPSEFMQTARKQNPDVDAAAELNPAAMALVYSLLWLIFLALWPVEAVLRLDLPYWGHRLVRHPFRRCTAEEINASEQAGKEHQKS